MKVTMALSGLSFLLKKVAQCPVSPSHASIKFEARDGRLWATATSGTLHLRVDIPLTSKRYPDGGVDAEGAMLSPRNSLKSLVDYMDADYCELSFSPAEGFKISGGGSDYLIHAMKVDTFPDIDFDVAEDFLEVASEDLKAGLKRTASTKLTTISHRIPPAVIMDMEDYVLRFVTTDGNAMSRFDADIGVEFSNRDYKSESIDRRWLKGEYPVSKPGGNLEDYTKFYRLLISNESGSLLQNLVCGDDVRCGANASGQIVWQWSDRGVNYSAVVAAEFNRVLNVQWRKIIRKRSRARFTVDVASLSSLIHRALIFSENQAIRFRRGTDDVNTLVAEVATSDVGAGEDVIAVEYPDSKVPVDCKFSGRMLLSGLNSFECDRVVVDIGGAEEPIIQVSPADGSPDTFFYSMAKMSK